MELSEVVTPHFAVPVVGVVLCAVLVFAFGFKSPVQPPSFDFIDEERKAKKSRQRDRTKKSSHSFGQTAEVDGSHKESSSAQISKTSPSGKQRSSPNPAQEKSESTALKTKKKPSAQSVKSLPAEVTQKSKEDDEGEWTTAVPKKKKQKSKKEEENDVHISMDIEDKVSQPAAAKVEKKTDAIAAPLEQREKKKSTKGSTKVFASNKENTAPGISQQKTDSSEESSKKTSLKKKLGGDTSENIMVQESPDIVKITAKSATGDKPNPVEVDEDGKWDIKSPKKKTKKTKTEVAVANEVSVEKKSDTREKLDSSIEPVIKETAPVQDNASLPTIAAKATEAVASSTVPSSNVTFDELGSWEEPKTAKKKKIKSRRDN